MLTNKLFCLLISMLLLPLCANTQNWVSISPLSYLQRLTTTSAIIRHLYLSQPPFNYHEKLEIKPMSRLNCLICSKRFKNESYLNLHYSLNHLGQLYDQRPSDIFPDSKGPFNPLSMEILYESSHHTTNFILDKLFYHGYSYLTEGEKSQKFKYCQNWLQQLRQDIEIRGIHSEGLYMSIEKMNGGNFSGKYPDYYRYVLETQSLELCSIIINRLFVPERKIFILKVIGITVALFLGTGIMFYEGNTNKKKAHNKFE